MLIIFRKNCPIILIVKQYFAETVSENANPAKERKGERKKVGTLCLIMSLSARHIS